MKMNLFQKKLHQMCKDNNLHFKKVNDYYFTNEDKFTAVDTLECMKHMMRNLTAEMFKCSERIEAAWK
jgi:hypothetical protein